MAWLVILLLLGLIFLGMPIGFALMVTADQRSISSSTCWRTIAATEESPPKPRARARSDRIEGGHESMMAWISGSGSNVTRPTDQGRPSARCAAVSASTAATASAAIAPRWGENEALGLD